MYANTAATATTTRSSTIQSVSTISLILFRLLHAQQASPLHKTTPRNMGPDSRLAQQQAVPESDCLWHSCIGHKRCHISFAVSHQRLRRSPIPLHCRRLNQYQRQLPRLSPHVLPLIQVQHLPERLVRCQRQRYQLQRHSLPGRGTRSEEHTSEL